MTGAAAPLGTGLDANERGLWAFQQLVPHRGVSNVATAIEVSGPARWWPVRRALELVVARHPALRRSFPAVNGVPVRREHRPDEVDVEVEVHQAEPGELAADLRRFAARPFELGEPPLVRAGLFIPGPDQHVICVVAHHIVTDAASLDTVLTDLRRAYLALSGGHEPPIAAPVPSRARSGQDESAVRYWRERLAGFDATGMRLEESAASPEEPAFSGAELDRVLTVPADMLAGLRRRCRATDSAILLAAFYLVLHEHGAAPDAVVGVMMDTRPEDAGDVGHHDVGYHVATVPLRVSLNGRAGFADLVARVSGEIVAGRENGAMPFELLATARPDRSEPAWWRGALVRHCYNFRPERTSDEPLGDGSRFRDVHTGLSRFDLELVVQPVAGTLRVGLQYATEIHDAAFAERFLDRFKLALDQAVADPGLALADFDLRTARDRHVVTVANRTAVPWPAPPTVLDMIVKAARDRPDAVAITQDGRATTYGRLMSAAATVRDAVLSHGRADHPLVAVAAPRGAGTAAAAIGVWAAGGCYVPLDPGHPPRRLLQQLDEAGCALVVGGDDIPPRCLDGRIRVPLPDPATAAGTGPDRFEYGPAPADPAYVIFTSGSTGRPKGVRLTHRNLANVVRHFTAELGLDASVAMTWLTTFAFDISTLELCLPLAVGGRVVVAPDESAARPAELLDLIVRERVSVIQATPTTWRLVAEHGTGRLTGRTILCGGEPLPSRLAGRLLATGARVFNVYGPTETTIWSTTTEITDPDARITIGRPIANTTVDIVDQRGRPRPVGLAGELCIGGAGVASGYHGRPDLTAERFGNGARLGRHYRTGDRARWLPDGTIELLGRADRQVKIRAHRIELGEVEAALETHPDVTTAAAIVVGDSAADTRITAFVVADRAGLETELWNHVSEVLPGYAVPSGITVLDALPTTANGKVDYRALAARPAGPPARGDHRNGAEATDETEAALIALWRSVLGRPDLDRDANFFLSGGHSLLAARLAQIASDTFGTPLTMGAVFRAPTPAAFATLVRKEAGR
ncbi:amino acid adenylation domain-containing protein [Actinomadura madurae]|uniref:non-ribosomal peptide synthetase n=1 Tax=Actinomadura madurae TaxID=1993 RepID=UPI000D999D49|nr:non-ribosomal peptide synthetase [Actinomadura madurae]SPT57298.1 Tyrocidine synthase III [Actinomadura madurae]